MTTKKTEPSTTAVTHPVIDGITYDVPTKDVEDWKNAGWKTETTKSQTGN